MAEFVIRLADERGHVQEQLQSAATADELRQRFTQAGYFVYSVKPRGLTGSARKTKLETFLIFNQQFLTLIKAGLPILGSLEMLAKGQKNPNFSGQLMNVAARVRTGEAISSAFEAQGGFPLMYTTTLLAGERSGNLEEVLGRYLAFQRITLTFRKKLVASLIYPALLITLVFGMFIFMITFVVPQFAKLYDQIGSQLPAITLAMLAIGRIAQHYLLYILPAMALVIFLVWRWSRSSSGAERLDGFRIAMPVFGKIWLKYQVAMFARTLSTLLSGGIPLVPSLETAPKKTAKPRKSRVFTISLPPDLAARAEAIAKQESRTMSEVFREALRELETKQIMKALREAAEYGATRNLHGYTEADVPRLVKEARAARRAQQEREDRKAG